MAALSRNASSASWTYLSRWVSRVIVLRKNNGTTYTPPAKEQAIWSCGETAFARCEEARERESARRVHVRLTLNVICLCKELSYACRNGLLDGLADEHGAGAPDVLLHAGLGLAGQRLLHLQYLVAALADEQRTDLEVERCDTVFAYHRHAPLGRHGVVRAHQNGALRERIGEETCTRCSPVVPKLHR